MNSYATAVGNTMLAAQEYERRCQEAELRARNARMQAERDAETAHLAHPSHPVPRSSGRGLGAAVGAMVVRMAARSARARSAHAR